MANLIQESKKSLEERLKLIDQATAAINKKHNKTICGRIGQDERIMDALTTKFIPTPSLDLNDAIGGGFPRGNMSIVAGQ